MTLQIDIQQLCAAGRPLITGLHLTVPAGEVHTVMGPSGSGKSCLLAAVCATLAAGLRFDGRVMLAGRRVDGLPTRARQIGLLFQDDLLFAHLTVRENLLFAVAAGPRSDREQQVRQALAAIGLDQLADANPATLSGGQRSRVALMRALLARPHALLLDEPFSRLDADLRDRMRALVFAAVKTRGIPALLVTHDLEDIADKDRLTRLDAANHLCSGPCSTAPLPH